MAFDTSTRNRLNQFVSDTRALLTEEFTNQFKQDYGLDPDTGEVADLDRLDHLEDARRQTAVILRDTLQHYYANLPTKHKDPNKDNQQLIERIIREQAFTVLNRLCAVRMAEARDLVIQSVTDGVQSKGFQLYGHVVGSSLGETGAAYQQFLFSIFDEFAVDLPVLFDRFSPQGRLFPRESVLVELLEQINHADIDPLWAEDETIGWIYQYFNSKEERKAMRDASQAPRNSRELAVRNQFFTPRYVVEFLTDNTLGRIWYEMRKGDTRLKDECQYLVRRPNEIFEEYDPEYQPDAQASESSTQSEKEPDSEDENTPPERDLTQEELLNQPVHIPHRPLKDPREIRMLDPACGSMHFGLYAFDLYLKIYEEYWDLIAQSPDTENHTPKTENLPPLTDLYPDKSAFLRDVPRLIIEHNIHGIDIDPRAVQIAGLSLWLRAQRAWKSQGLAAADRPQVTRSNVVCAEPMPGDQQQLEAFCKQLHPAIAQMVTAIFEEMKLAGEAGSLLKIEQEISALVAAAKKQYQDNPPDKKSQMALFGGASVVKEKQLEFDLSGITDELFFEKAEEEIYSALKKYASESLEGGFRRKLFANDAERGFAFIELCQKRFDVSLMNPPFGSATRPTFKYLERTLPYTKRDILTSFVASALIRTNDGGMVGAITSRTPLFTSFYEEWRSKHVLGESRIQVLADLGLGVLDDAMVETAAYVICNGGSQNEFVAFKNQGAEKPDANLKSMTSFHSIDDTIVTGIGELLEFPGMPLAYAVSPGIRRAFAVHDSLKVSFGQTAQGLGTTDDFRFCRLSYEVPGNAIRTFSDARRSSKISWVPYAKGEPVQPFFARLPIVVNWSQDGSEVKEYNRMRYGSASRHVCNEKLYGKPGLVFARRTKRFMPRLYPTDSIFSVGGQVIIPDELDTIALLGIAVSDVADALLKALLAVTEMNPQYEVGVVARLPIPVIENDSIERLKQVVTPLLDYWKERETLIETQFQRQSFRVLKGASSISESVAESAVVWDQKEAEYLEQLKLLNSLVIEFYSIESGDIGKDSCLEPPGNPIVDDHGECERIFLSSLQFLYADAEHKNIEVFVDEVAHPSDIVQQVKEVFSEHWGENAEVAWESLENNLGGVRKWLSQKFFAVVLELFSELKRSAPIYWPISTESGSYTLWFYYHRLTDQTLYLAVNDFVDPKLKDTLRQLAELRAIKDRTSKQEKELAQLTELESELEQFKADLLEIAAFWKPNLNDGVQITAAPLHKFFRLKKWRDKLAKTWKELQDGKYDWAHLALSIWPDRVVREKCITDRSIAIAHDLEEQLWEEREIQKTSKTGRVTTKMQWMPKELSDKELDTIVEEVKAR